MNIVLIGFMGTGKTAVAKEISDKTGRKYVSIDAEIEKKENKPISDIFKDNGEKYFRDLEKDIIKKVANLKNLVIDTGGGAVKDKNNIDNLRKNGIIVCLVASADIIYKRIKHHSHRPLLNVENPFETIKELLDKRKEFYKQADLHINTDSLNIKQTADKILSWCSGKNN